MHPTLKKSMHENLRPSPKLDVICNGSPYEMGRAQGTTLAEKIRRGRHELKLLDAFRNEQPRWLPYPLFLSYAERKVAGMIGPGIAAEYPAMQERLRGIAAGAGVSLKTLLLLNGFEALMASVQGRFEVAVAAVRGACSAVAVRGSRSSTGQPIIARNFDYLTIVQPFYTLRESRPAGGMRSLEFTTAPQPGTVDGVNEAGLCITYNYALSLDEPAKNSGLISMAISEAMAHCRTVDDAIAWISSRPRWGGGILMLADEAGNLASLELSSTRSWVRRPAQSEDVIFHTNCYAGAELCAVQVPSNAVLNHRAPRPLRGKRPLQSAECRRDRFCELLAMHNRLGPNELASVLSDHGSSGQPTDDTICMHSSYWNTTAALQWFPRERKVRVSYGSTCQADFVELQLRS
jgi:hypothetical protein